MVVCVVEPNVIVFQDESLKLESFQLSELTLVENFHCELSKIGVYTKYKIGIQHFTR